MVTIYALLDKSGTIEAHHLKAALGLRNYSARSAAWALDQSCGDPLAEQIHVALLAAPEGLTHTELRDLFWRNQSAQSVDLALGHAQLDPAVPTRDLRGSTRDRRGSSTDVRTGADATDAWTSPIRAGSPRSATHHRALVRHNLVS